MAFPLKAYGSSRSSRSESRMPPMSSGGTPPGPDRREPEWRSGEDELGRAPSAAEAMGGGASLFGLRGRELRLLGTAFLVLGLFLFLGGAFYGMTGPGPPQNSMDTSTWFQDSTARMVGGFAIAAVGIALLGIGGWALRFGLIRPVASFVAEEASPALTTASAAIGRGLGEAGLRMASPASAPAVRTVVKVKCTHCGHLNEESARFCDDCGKPL